MPVRTPLSSTSAGKPKYRPLISGSAGVTRGTPDASASPVTCASNEKPWNPRNCWNINASSSEVRSAAVAIRQWSTSSWPEKSPMTVWVFPQSIVSSTRYLARSLLEVDAEVERRRRLGDRARRDEVGTRRGIVGDGAEREGARDIRHR